MKTAVERSKEAEDIRSEVEVSCSSFDSLYCRYHTLLVVVAQVLSEVNHIL